MGIFDMVFVDCPHCGEPVEFQSKASEDAYMRHFTLADAPAEILADIMNDPNHCQKCDGWLALIDLRFPPGEKPKPNLRIAKVRTPPNPETPFQGMKWWPESDPFTFADVIGDGVESESDIRSSENP